MMEKETKFKQTEIGMIPEDWEVISFDDIEFYKGKKPKEISLEPKKGFLPQILIEVLDGNPPIYANPEDCIICKKDDLIMVMDGASSGRISNGFKGILGSTLAIVKQKNNIIDNKFLYFVFLNKQSELRGNTTGSAIPHADKNRINSMKIAVPKSKEEQSAIASTLSSLDSKIELNRQMNKTLEAIGQAIFKHWFVDFEFPNEEGKPYKSSGGEIVNSELGEIPKGWRVSKIGDELKTVLGGTPSTTKKSYWESGTIGWINSGKINEFRITEPTAYITEEAVNNSATKLLPKGTAVLAITGATLGQVSRIEIGTCANQSVIGIIESKTISSEYIYFWIKYTIGEIIRNQTGGAQQHINKNNVDNSTILIPSEKVIEEYQRIIKPIFDKISLACFESLTLSQLRDLLLPKLMTGKIRVPLEEKE